LLAGPSLHHLKLAYSLLGLYHHHLPALPAIIAGLCGMTDKTSHVVEKSAMFVLPTGFPNVNLNVSNICINKINMLPT